MQLRTYSNFPLRFFTIHSQQEACTPLKLSKTVTQLASYSYVVGYIHSYIVSSFTTSSQFYQLAQQQRSCMQLHQMITTIIIQLATQLSNIRWKLNNGSRMHTRNIQYIQLQPNKIKLLQHVNRVFNCSLLGTMFVNKSIGAHLLLSISISSS